MSYGIAQPTLDDLLNELSSGGEEEEGEESEEELESEEEDDALLSIGNQMDILTLS